MQRSQVDLLKLGWDLIYDFLDLHTILSIYCWIPDPIS